MRVRSVAILLAAIASASFDRSARGLDVVTSGRAQTAIVIPDEPTDVVRLAAREFQYHVRRATDAELPILSESAQPEGDGLIYLGPCRKTLEAKILPQPFSPNGFVVRQVDGDLFIAGDDTDGQPAWILHNNRNRVGTLFAVYELLERHLDVRWLWPGELGEVIPKRSDVKTDGWDHTGTPTFVHTRWRDGGNIVAGPQGWASPKARSQYLADQSIWMRRHRFALGVDLDIRHAFTGWWDRHHQDHPEFFNFLPDGTRRSDPTYHGGAPELVSMCVAEPAFWKAIVKEWQRTRSSQYPYLDASENDTPGKCTCEKCLAWDVADRDLEIPFDRRIEHAKNAFREEDRDWWQQLGSLSDRYARYYLAVQKEAEKIDPEVVVLGFAYSNYYKPPQEVRLNDRIIIGIVPGIGFPWTDGRREAFRRQWDGWSAAGARLLLRPNYMLYGHNLPVFLARKIGEDFSYAAGRGMIGTDYDSLTGQWAAQGPNLYVLARLHHRPEIPVDEVLAEYYAGFGPAVDAVRAYFAHWQQVTDGIANQEVPGLHYSTFYREAHLAFTPEVMATGDKLLAQAEESARGNDLAARRVAFLRKGLTHAERTLAVQPAYRAYREEGDLAGYRDAIAQLDDFRKSVESDNVANMAFLAWAEAYTWSRAALKSEPETSNQSASKPDPPVAPEKNLVANGGFEFSERDWARSRMCGQFEFAVDSVESHGGTRSARLRCTILEPEEPQRGWGRAWARWYQGQIPVEEGRTFRLRLWVKTSKVFGGRVAIWVTGAAEHGTMTAEVHHTDGAWREVVIDDIVPAGENVGLYFNLMAGVGTAWFDDVELTEAGS
ncbi:MAG: DUF4838 domain-containing protein [Planctomycetes bacterium]|nr:DUF4838 domain-containing protein [Planctomycetota bacterium]